MARVLIAGRVRLYREGLAGLLAGEEDIDVVGTAVGCEEMLALVEQRTPQIVLVDLMQDGIDALRLLCREAAGVRVVALAVRDAEEEVIACAEAGVAGYVTRDASAVELVNVVRSVSRGETVTSPRMALALLRHVADLAARVEPGDGAASLTRREREVVELIGQGLTNKEIGAALHIELPTVKNHIHHILEKLQVRRRSEAVERVRATGRGTV
jgi:DNA-binding NarL/FixJ family response regulator